VRLPQVGDVYRRNCGAMLYIKRIQTEDGVSYMVYDDVEINGRRYEGMVYRIDEFIYVANIYTLVSSVEEEEVL
jgi:hypothetical protein